MKSIESGAGRFTDFLLPPLNFAEFLRFTGIEEKFTDYEKNEYDVVGLNEAFVDYVNFGAFPEAVLIPEVRARMDRFVANDIVDKVLLRDLPSLYGIADTQELKRFFTVLAYNTGEEVSLEGLAQASGVAKNTLRKYLDYLEAAFLIHRLHRIDRNARRFKRITHFKVYLTNPSIRAALFGPVTSDSQAMGHLAETAYVAQMSSSWLSLYNFYARWSNGEVDLVLMDDDFQRPRRAEEIKWSDRPADRPQEELKSLIKFCKINELSEANVLVKSRISDDEIQGVRLIIRPLSVRCYVNARIYFDGPIVEGLDPRTFLPLGSPVVD